MKTKEKILSTALKLYNEKGFHATTTRHIAAVMKISPGNLHYHFNQTDDITKALYKQLAKEFDNLISIVESEDKIKIKDIEKFSIQSLELMYKYRFVFLHFVEICRRIPDIAEDYRKLTKRRTKQFLEIFAKLIKNKTFRSDLPKSIWASLVNQIFIVGDFWLSNNELTNKLTGKKAIKYYKQTIDMMFLPYLAIK